MGVGPKPPAIDLVKVVKKSNNKVVLEGTNVNEGYPVKITRESPAWRTEYFLKDGRDMKVTFDPDLDKDK